MVEVATRPERVCKQHNASLFNLFVPDAWSATATVAGLAWSCQGVLLSAAVFASRLQHASDDSYSAEVIRDSPYINMRVVTSVSRHHRATLGCRLVRVFQKAFATYLGMPVPRDFRCFKSSRTNMTDVKAANEYLLKDDIYETVKVAGRMLTK